MDLVQYCKSGDLDSIKILLQQVPTIDVSANNEEAFRWACRYGQIDIVRYLVEIKPTIDIFI